MSSASNSNEEFRVEAIEFDHRVVVALIGELHAATASVLGDCLAQLSRIGSDHG